MVFCLKPFFRLNSNILAVAFTLTVAPSDTQLVHLLRSAFQSWSGLMEESLAICSWLTLSVSSNFWDFCEKNTWKKYAKSSQNDNGLYSGEIESHLNKPKAETGNTISECSLPVKHCEETPHYWISTSTVQKKHVRTFSHIMSKVLNQPLFLLLTNAAFFLGAAKLPFFAA